jgi:hypothetical protein
VRVACGHGDGGAPHLPCPPPVPCPPTVEVPNATQYYFWLCQRQGQPPAQILVLKEPSGGMRLGVHQVRRDLAGGVGRNKFDRALDRSTRGPATREASKGQVEALKRHAGYPAHSSCVKTAAVWAVRAALASLKLLPPCMASSFDQLVSNGVRSLRPAPQGQPQQAAAAQGAQPPSRPASGAAAAAAAAGAGGAPSTEVSATLFVHCFNPTACSM